ncbi:hypothetical protein ACQW5G_05350 [Fructilactobacillus sp. Tb1]|uniref:hypothetical protein n=1 Tax=Fructilactobacillus sp. Tb1 TaxID=3422304 RepID=UPI003D2DEAAD
MNLNIEISDGQIAVTGPFNVETDEGRAEFVNFWKHFITQQVKKIMDHIGDKEFSMIVSKADNVQLGALPAKIELNIELDVKKDEKDETKSQVQVGAVTVSPDLDDAKFLFLLGYVDAAITKK